MRLTRRIRRLKRVLGRPSDVVVPVVSFGDDDERAAARVAEVEAKGWRVHLIVVGVELFAQNEEQALKLIAAERARGSNRPITVIGPPPAPGEDFVVLAKSGNPGRDILCPSSADVDE